MKSSPIVEQLKKDILGFEDQLRTEKIGHIVTVGDGIVRALGLAEVRAGEMVAFSNGTKGVVLNLEEDNVGIMVLGEITGLQEGQEVSATGELLQMKVGPELAGRVVNALGEPLDGKGAIKAETTRLIETDARGVIEREAVTQPMYTGLKAIDAMIPIGRGQRELIIGDRQTGKTAIAIDAMIRQKFEPAETRPHCIYVAIGQKRSSVARLVKTLEEQGALEYTTVVAATAADPAALLFLAPYTGCTLGEYFRDRGQDALIIYDDLTKHAWAYRQISALLRRPPGREAYPGDIFYLHSRLLERASKLSKAAGGGSLTALPIVETQAGDISGYIPTNVISITDGQIYLEADLFYKGVRPAINVGLSVSRVGSAAQAKAMKQVAGRLRLDLAQFRELEAFAQFGSELDAPTQAKINRGQRMVEILKQIQLAPKRLSEQVVLIFAGANGFLDTLPPERLNKYEVQLLDFLRTQQPAILEEIEKNQVLSPELTKKMETALTDFLAIFIQ